MDFSQTKLTKEEWDALEVPTTGREFDIIDMIHKAGDDINIYIKNTTTLLDFIKITSNVEKYHYYLFEKYFQEVLKKINKKNTYFEYDFKCKEKKKMKLKKGDLIKLKNFDKRIDEKKDIIFEYKIIHIITKMFKSEDKSVYVYLLNYLLNLKMTNLNTYVLRYIEKILSYQ